MLVSAVSMLGAAVVAWSNSNFAIQRLNVANAIDDRLNQAREGFIVEDVWFYTDTGTNYVTVTVRNTGDVAINVSSILVDNVQAWNAGQIILSDEAGSITFENDWTGSGEHSISVKTERGTVSKQLWSV